LLDLDLGRGAIEDLSHARSLFGGPGFAARAQEERPRDVLAGADDFRVDRRARGLAEVSQTLPSMSWTSCR
jgi:hypothetical protein